MSNVFRKKVVFGAVPIGNPSDISINMINHINDADIILVESHREFSRLITSLNSLPGFIKPDLKPHAFIYPYQLESGDERIKEINNKIINDIKNNKKVLIVSDEGSSVFLEPMMALKSILLNLNIDFDVLPGPNSVIASFVSGTNTFVEFCFGGNFEWIAEKRKQEIFYNIKDLKIPTIFILRSIGLKQYITEIKNNLGNDWRIDLAMNLTMDTEKHIDGTFDQALQFIDNNLNLWEYEEEYRKIICMVYPFENVEKYEKI